MVVTFADQRVAAPAAAADLRPVIERHLRALAARELPARLLELAASRRIPVGRITIRNQRTRWGSCSEAGVIALNWRLVQMPDAVRDYVMLHELLHTRELRHSRRFWRLVAEACPGHREARAWLKAYEGEL